MGVRLTYNTYGKSEVRVVKLIKHKTYHEFREVTVEVLLEGDFEAAHVKGDNRQVLPTDTVKNTIFILAKDHLTDTIEEFGMFVADYFLNKNEQVEKVSVEIYESLWNRIPVEKNKRTTQHPHAYMAGSSELWTCAIQHTKDETVVTSGLEDLRILKTTNSGFSKFYKDDYTTLKDADDRIFSTRLSSNWTYASNKIDFTKHRENIRQALLTSFADHKSKSVQHTLYAMGKAALKASKQIPAIYISMPNVHNLLVNFEPFGLENNNEIFIGTSDPYGQIEGVIARD